LNTSTRTTQRGSRDGSPPDRIGSLLPRRAIALGPVARYVVAVVIAVIAILARQALDPLWGTKLPYITLFPAVMASAWLGGVGPGLLTTVMTATAAEYFWIEPAGSWAVLDKSELIGLVVFVGVGAFISVLNEAWRRAIDNVASSEERLAVTIRSIGDGVVVTDDRGCVRRINPIGEALTGWTEAEAVGQPLTSVLVLLNEHTRQPVSNPVERVLREGAIVGLANHTILVAKDGREIPIDDSAGPVRSSDGRIFGAVMVFRDISERRRIERERAESERTNRELASIVESTDDAIIGMTLDGVVTAWNPAAEQMYGYSAAEMIGESIQRLVPSEGWDDERAVLERIRQGERVEHYETVRRRKDGSALAVSLTISPIRDHAGDVIGISKIARDITGRRQLDEQRAAMLAREHDARVEIERASQLKDEFLAVLSHELRTPLNAVLGYAHLLGSGTLSPERAQHAMAAIQRNAQAQARLVESLLDLSRILAGKLELDRRPQNVGAIIDAALEAVRAEAEAKGTTFDVSGLDSPMVVSGDATRLQQVFWNLFSNAIKFTARNGRVDVRALTRETIAVIEVADNGQGIPAEFLPHVFDRFKQADGGKPSRAGLGLGLAVAREMVQAHGGTIEAESLGEGRGSTFRVTLPLAIDVAHEDIAGAVLPATDQSLAHLDILIVDDDEDARDLLSLILESRGARTRSVTSAQEALDAIVAHRPNVLLSDLRMPNEDGYFLIRQVRGRENGGRRLPAIAVTANASLRDRDHSLAAGYDMHISKPVDPAELARLIVRVTNAHGV
jgi:PAS domain S-box-containing protein